MSKFHMPDYPAFSSGITFYHQFYVCNKKSINLRRNSEKYLLTDVCFLVCVAVASQSLLRHMILKNGHRREKKIKRPTAVGDFTLQKPNTVLTGI